MEREVVIENEFMTMWYYPVEKIVYHQFHKYMFGEHLRQGLLTGAELLAEHRAKKWLSDDRMSSAVHPDDSAWAEINWFPKARRAGWKYWAIVPPQKVVGQMNMKALVEQYAQYGLTAQFFTEPAQAFLWLKRQE